MEKRWKIDLLNFMKMKDTNWIKPHLQRLFNESVTIGEKYSLTFNKIKQFGGKLYKYYSFEDEWSLKNLEGDIIHFSKPQAFNDPFDCALGFSIDRAVEMLLPTIFDKKLNLSNENPKTKEMVQLLLSGQSTMEESKEAKLLQLIINLPSVQEAIKMRPVGNDKVLQAKMVDELFTGPKAKDFFALIQSEGGSIDLTNISTDAIYLTLVKPLLKQPKLIESLIPKGIDEKEKSSVVKLINVLSGNHIIEKIKGLAELSGQDSKKLEKELFDIDVKLKAGLQNIKVGINKTFAICCFSEASDNVLMWSHYGNKHTGFCVEYDFSRCKDLDALIRLFPVQYTNERPSIPTDLFDLSDIKNIKVAIGNKVIPDLMMLLLTKSRIWEYENEWRIIGDQANLKDGHIQDLPIESGIYLGANISSINAERITRIARDKRINLYKYHIDNEKYKLCLEKVKN